MKKKKLLKALIITVAVIALLLIVMPYIILAIVKQPKVDESHKYSKYFVHSYEESRENIQKRVEELKGKGIEVNYTTNEEGSAIVTVSAKVADNVEGNFLGVDDNGLYAIIVIDGEDVEE